MNYYYIYGYNIVERCIEICFWKLTIANEAFPNSSSFSQEEIKLAKTTGIDGFVRRDLEPDEEFGAKKRNRK